MITLLYIILCVQAEAELLAAITLFFERVGLSSKDVGIKVSSRKVGVTITSLAP
jgi:histidyl-tRNA synthetase